MKKFIATLCAVLMVLCISFTFVGCFGDDDKDDNAEDYGQYFVDDCPIGFSEMGTGVGSSSLDLTFKNISGKEIIAYEAMFILYDVYDSPLIYLGDTTKYNKMSVTPTNFNSNGTYFKRYSTNSQVYYAEVYIYYALFEDRTGWGCRENISDEKIVEFSTMYKVERYSY